MGGKEGGRWDDGWWAACSSWDNYDAKTTSPIKTTSFKTPTSPALCLSLSLSPHCPVGTLLWTISHSSLRPAFHAHVLPFLYWPPWRYSSFSCPPLGLPWSYSVEFSKTHSWPQALLSLNSHLDGQEGALKQTKVLEPRGNRGDWRQLTRLASCKLANCEPCKRESNP